MTTPPRARLTATLTAAAALAGCSALNDAVNGRDAVALAAERALSTGTDAVATMARSLAGPAPDVSAEEQDPVTFTAVGGGTNISITFSGLVSNADSSANCMYDYMQRIGDASEGLAKIKERHAKGEITEGEIDSIQMNICAKGVVDQNLIGCFTKSGLGYSDEITVRAEFEGKEFFNGSWDDYVEMAKAEHAKACLPRPAPGQ